MKLEQLNHCTADGFTEALGAIFEHSPWLATAVVPARPFASVAALHAAMCQVLRHAGVDAQLRLIRAHPELAGKAAIRGELTADSSREQHAAGLDQCSPEEYAQLRQLNDDYQRKFGFPFILAVRGHTRSSVIASMRERIARPTTEELAECLRQIERIAQLRLDALLSV